MVLRCCRQLRLTITKNAHGGIAQEHVHTVAQRLSTAKISIPFTWLLSASMANRIERRLLELNWLLEHASSESWVAPTMPDKVVLNACVLSWCICLVRSVCRLIRGIHTVILCGLYTVLCLQFLYNAHAYFVYVSAAAISITNTTRHQRVHGLFRRSS